MCGGIFTQSIGAAEMEVGNLVSDCVNTDKRCANDKQFAHPTLAIAAAAIAEQSNYSAYRYLK